MKKQIATFLTFQENNAEQAMNFYVELFENSKIIDVQRHGKDGPAKEGTIMKAAFELKGNQFICSDSYVKDDWTLGLEKRIAFPLLVRMYKFPQRII